MSDLEDAIQALRNADAAGNAEDAQGLAAIVDRLSKQQMPPSSGLQQFRSGLEEGAQNRSATIKGFVRGARDIPDFGALAYTRLGEAITNNPLYQRMSVLSPEQAKEWGQLWTNERERVAGINKRAEQDYAQNWMGGQPEKGAFGRVLGNVAASAPIAAALPGAAAQTVAGRAGVGALQGALGGLTQKTQDTEDYWSDAAKKAGLGALIGGVTSGAVSLGQKAIAGSSDEGTRALADAGIRPSMGQTSGNATFNKMEQKFTSMPLTGDMARTARTRAVDQFNRETVNKVLAPIGEKLDASTSIGFDAVEEAAKKTSAKYEELLPKLTGRIDQQFIDDVSNLRTLAANLPGDRAAQFDSVIRNQITSKVSGNGVLTGQSLKEAESEIGRLAKQYWRSPIGDERLLGDAFGELQATLRDWVARANPDQAAALRANNTSWAMLKRLEKAATLAGTREGVFTPSQFMGAVRMADPTANKAAFSRGNALMQDWARAGMKLGETVPNSGTWDRAILGAGTLAGLGGTSISASPLFVSPWTAIGYSLTGVPYLPLIRDLPGYLAKSPNVAGRVADTALGLARPALSLGAPSAANQMGLLGP